ncbi:hypothetical protein AB0O76_14555 [Streptomyces sp. NPDC086554]|uniref:hypothetical protein n=1 Tax=Streptomyces sp. NPDC086554 TaxID=3154864 RepID=UPI00343B4852
MSEWGVALVAAGAAIAGSVVTGWYGRAAGMRQAEAARHAGDRQAEALLASVRMTLGAEAERRVSDLRRQTYAEFLAAAESRLLAERTGQGDGHDEALLYRALSAVALEGPTAVTEAAHRLIDSLRRHEGPDELQRAREAFISVAKAEVSGNEG